MTIKALGENWFLAYMNANLLLIKRRRLSQKEKNKEDNIKIKIQKANDHWNDWKFHLHCKTI